MGFAHAYAQVTLEARWATYYSCRWGVRIIVQKVAKTNAARLFRVTHYTLSIAKHDSMSCAGRHAVVLKQTDPVLNIYLVLQYIVLDFQFF
jgi:hypothetical protein